MVSDEVTVDTCDTDTRGPLKGTSEIVSAADAPSIERVSAGFLRLQRIQLR